MIAAAYCRKSTKDAGDTTTRSVQRQLSDAREFAAKKGWVLADEHCYLDDEVSAVDWARRAAWHRLVAAAEVRAFDILLVWEQSRIARDARGLVELEMLEELGVRIWDFSADRPISLLDEGGEVQAMVGNLMDRLERRRARARSRDGGRALARSGFVAGGRVLGYRTVGPTKAKRYEIDPEQAVIVRRIFEMAAGGLGLLRIARRLNVEGVVNPTGQRRQRRPGQDARAVHWAATGIRAVLWNRRYLGEVAYGRRQNEYRRGQRIKVAGPEPIVLRDEALRIVSAELWEAAHQRLSATHAVYLERTGGHGGRKPGSGLESRYLLSGFLACGVCGGSLIINRATSKRGEPVLRYICSTHKVRGDAACANRHGVPAPALTAAVVDRLRHIFMNPIALMETAAAERARQRAAPDSAEAERRTAQARLETLGREIDNLTAALADGQARRALLEAITTREAERAALLARLEHLDGLLLAAADDFTIETWIRELKESLAALAAMIEDAPQVSRQALRRLLRGQPITVTPKPRGGFAFSGTIYFWEVLVGGEVLGARSYDLPPMPFSDGTLLEPRPAEQALAGTVQQWCPRGDSNTRHAV